MTLDEHLGAIYSAQVLNKPTDTDTAQVFKVALSEDPELKAVARARLASFVGVDDDRCFISKMQRQFLTAALGGL